MESEGECNDLFTVRSYFDCGGDDGSKVGCTGVEAESSMEV